MRVFVPLAAMSAATMWAMAADEIVMAAHSQLGPTDPQVNLPTGLPMPAGALTAQFKEAPKQCLREPGRLAAWMPTLQQFPPGILEVCGKAAALTKRLVGQWLEAYMLQGQPDRNRIAQEAAEWLSDDEKHLSHGRPIMRDDLRGKELTVTDLEDNPDLYEAAMGVSNALVHAFAQNPGPVKIFANQLGGRFVQHGGTQQIIIPGMPVAPPPSPAPPHSRAPGPSPAP